MADRTRAWRRQQKRRVARARRRYARPDQSDNELAIRHPLDCGRRCLLCHMDKLLGAGRRRAQAKRASSE